MHRAFGTNGPEAFLEGHAYAFDRLGGVPWRHVRYDNLKTAVVKILTGRDRTENERFTLLRSHYGFESFFCEPGIAGAHEKGGVEGDIGWFRRNHLTPVPAFDTLADARAVFAQRAGGYTYARTGNPNVAATFASCCSTSPSRRVPSRMRSGVGKQYDRRRCRLPKPSA